MEQTILEKINQLEQQILVHSIMYYRLGASIWDDFKYDSKAKELQALIQANPEEFKKSILYEDFKEFSWKSGYDLPLWDNYYTAVAMWLIDYHKRRKGGA